MRVAVIGDVHGCVDELGELFAALPDDALLVFVGDLIDKGPYPAATVIYVRHLWEQRPVVLLRGNHEDKILRWRAHEVRCAGTGERNPMTLSPDHAVLLDSLGEADLAFLEAAPLFWRHVEWDLLVVHGGIEPALAMLPGARSLLRTRYVDDAGRMVALAQRRPEHRFWAPLYDGRFGYAVFGHEVHWQGADARSPWYAHACAVDHGCVHGGRLAAAIFTGPVVPFARRPQFVTVPARGTYTSREREPFDAAAP